MPEPQILLTGLAIGESPRWHEDRLWFSNWGTQEIVAVDLEGNSEVMARVLESTARWGSPRVACLRSPRGHRSCPGRCPPGR